MHAVPQDVRPEELPQQTPRVGVYIARGGGAAARGDRRRVGLTVALGRRNLGP